MTDTTIQRINLTSFLIALTTIVFGVVIGIVGVWNVVVTDALWKLLGTDAILFAGAVLTNLAIACYKKPGGNIA